MKKNFNNPIVTHSRELSLGFGTLKIDPARDSFKIVGGAGVIKAHAKKATGEVVSVHLRAGFEQITKFDPAQLSIDERRTLTRSLSDDNWTQSEIADLLGVSQALISRDLKKLNKLDG